MGKNGTDISKAGNFEALEFAAIQLFYCSLEVRSSFELDETSESVSIGLVSKCRECPDPLPSRSRPVSE
jgi:hypothetical protein